MFSIIWHYVTWYTIHPNPKQSTCVPETPRLLGISSHSPPHSSGTWARRMVLLRRPIPQLSSPSPGKQQFLSTPARKARYKNCKLPGWTHPEKPSWNPHNTAWGCGQTMPLVLHQPRLTGTPYFSALDNRHGVCLWKTDLGHCPRIEAPTKEEGHELCRQHCLHMHGSWRLPRRAWRRENDG